MLLHVRSGARSICERRRPAAAARRVRESRKSQEMSRANGVLGGEQCRTDSMGCPSSNVTQREQQKQASTQAREGADEG
jgi:hypothetical protein